MKQSKWMSRKFIVSLVTQIGALMVLFWPEHESLIVQTTQCLGALAVTLLAGWGYLATEGALDRRGMEGKVSGNSLNIE
jgi:hypothetical protein